ncbi:hypothetical protein EJ08DRAFT_646234 [Tothia fuscella]|uniref:Uncharacterized protein n=1 Tax=Tothia fuscella TaxID=1048955 RepID=A0A9P4U2E8_9PEZI|nr:hypothetical protein EJ08DRAFT_646234 [Tothia fuscella]
MLKRVQEDTTDSCKRNFRIRLPPADDRAQTKACAKPEQPHVCLGRQSRDNFVQRQCSVERPMRSFGKQSWEMTFRLESTRQAQRRHRRKIEACVIVGSEERTSNATGGVCAMLDEREEWKFRKDDELDSRCSCLVRGRGGSRVGEGMGLGIGKAGRNGRNFEPTTQRSTLNPKRAY